MKYLRCVTVIILIAFTFSNAEVYSQEIKELDTQYYYYLNFDKKKNVLLKADTKTVINRDIGEIVTTTSVSEKDKKCYIEEEIRRKSKNNMSKVEFQCIEPKTVTLSVEKDKAKVVYKANTRGDKEYVEVVHSFTSYRPSSISDIMEW